MAYVEISVKSPYILCKKGRRKNVCINPITQNLHIISVKEAAQNLSKIYINPITQNLYIISVK